MPRSTGWHHWSADPLPQETAPLGVAQGILRGNMQLALFMAMARRRVIGVGVVMQPYLLGQEVFF